MKILTRWEVLVFRKYLQAPFIDPSRAPALNTLNSIELDITVNEIRKTLGLPTSFVLHPDCKKQTILTGTLAFTQNSTTVTGTGTAFLSEVAANDYLYWNYGQTVMRVDALVLSNTSLTLTSQYKGQSESGLTVKVSSVLDRGLSYVYADETPLADDYLIPAWAVTALTAAGYGPFDKADCA